MKGMTMRRDDGTHPWTTICVYADDGSVQAIRYALGHWNRPSGYVRVQIVLEAFQPSVIMPWGW